MSLDESFQYLILCHIFGRRKKWFSSENQIEINCRDVPDFWWKFYLEHFSLWFHEVKINKFTRALGVWMTPWNRKIRQSFLFSPLLWHKFAWIFIQIFGFDFVWYYNLIIGKSFIRNEINLSIFVAKKRKVKYVYFLFAWTSNYVVVLMYIVLYTDFTI